MAFPPNVPELATTRTRVRQPREPRSLSPDGAHDGIPPSAGIGGPVIDFGLLGGARPIPGTDRWRWIKAKRDSKPRRLKQKNMKIWADDEGYLLFPPTRKEDVSTTDLTEGEAAHAATIYLEETLDKYDHLGVRDLIADELSQLAGPSRVSRITPDVFMGRTLAVVLNSRAKLVRAVVCFPAGPVGCQLNVSPFLPASNPPSRNTGAKRFVPCAKPAVEFQTPILQIESSPVISINRLDRDASCLIVREYSFTHLFHMVPNPTYIPPTPDCPVEMESIGVLSPSDTAGLRHVDVALDPVNFGRALIVDECGGVWQWVEEKKSVAERLGLVAKLVQVRQAITQKRGGFFRIAYGTRPGTAVVMSRRNIVVLDLPEDGQGEAEGRGRRGAGEETNLLEIQGDGRVFTSLEKTAAQRGATFTVAATTYEVVWFDECQVGPPALSWRHEYGGGTLRELDLAFVQHSDEEVLLLCSRSQPLIIAFHMSSDPPIKSHRNPYALRLPKTMGQPLSSLSFVHLQKDRKSRTPTVLIGLAPDGSLCGVSLFTMLERQEDAEEGGVEEWKKNEAALRIKWENGVEKLVEEVKNGDILEKEDRLRGTRYREMNLRWAWLEINKQRERDGGPEQETEEGPSSVVDMNEFERYIRELDAPFEHMATAAELVRDVVHGPIEGIRSNLLRQLQVLDYQAEAHLPNVNINRHLPHIATYLLQASADLDVFPHPRSADLETRERFETDLCSLSLDLALSQIVVHSENVEIQPRLDDTQQTSSADSGPDEMFARASLLSLNDKEPPRVDFGFLAPRPPIDLDQGDFQAGPDRASSRRGKGSAARGPQEGIESLSVRALLDEWVVGSNPSSYEWTPWRGDTVKSRGPTQQSSQDSNTTPGRPIRQLPSQKTPTKYAFTQPTNLPRPPVIKTSSSTLFPPVVRPDIPALGLARPTAPVGGATGAGATIHGRGGMARSSPPPMPPSSQLGLSQSLEMIGMASTQIVRGPFGGRTGGGGAKKKVKKRVGGF